MTGLFGSAVRSIVFDGVEHCGQLIAEEDGNDSGRSFIGAETVIVAGGCDGESEKILIIVNGFDDGAQEEQELSVFIRGFAGSQKVYAGIGCH